jgi:ABC-type sugar transport system ATPase subunit
MEPVLEMRKVTKEYHGAPAVKSVDFTLEKGEVHGLLGENGAGKSTLTKIMAGAITVTGGVMLLNGREVIFKNPNEALENGIAMVFQENSLVPSMSVAQNIYLGREKLINRLRGLNISAQVLLAELNFDVDPMSIVKTLSAGKMQMVEIARAVVRNAQIIIFDEPTASLTPEEKYYFFALIDRLKVRGISTIFITHVIEEALSKTDRLTIMRDGEIVAEGETSNFDINRIVKAMIGRKGYSVYDNKTMRTTRPFGKKALSVENLSMGNIVRNNSFSVYEGQVTTLFGLLGCGRTETAKIVSGVVKRNFFNGGAVKLYGKKVRYRTPRPSVLDGILYVTEDRKAEGFFNEMTIGMNMYMGFSTSRLNKAKIVKMSEINTLAEYWCGSLSIRTIDEKARVIELSGGNQQKVVIGKGLIQKPKVIIFDEPTRGVDVGSITEIHEIINRLADEGLCVIVISSYLPEVMKISDRILVAQAGRVVEEFSPSEATEEKIMYAAVH